MDPTRILIAVAMGFPISNVYNINNYIKQNPVRAVTVSVSCDVRCDVKANPYVSANVTANL